ncbi:hypothetical protein LguiB_028874 [Lonicera macranthoides]
MEAENGANPVSETEPNHLPESETTSSGQKKKEILKALEVVERDSVAIAESFTSLFASLRSNLSQVTGQSVEHMRCFNDASGHLQECALDAATKGNKYIHSCLRLNEDVKGIDAMAMQLKILRRNVDALDSAANKILFLP